MESPLALSNAARLTISTLGEERQTLLSVDDALPDCDLVRTIAARHRFRPIGPHYPGIRAPVSAGIAMPLVEPIADAMREAFGLAEPLTFGECYLSIVTLHPGQLAPIQRLPHFDGVERERIAVLLYLDPAAAGGTAFYRQKATGFETVTTDRFETFTTQLRRGIAENGLPDAGYIDGDTPLFQRFHLIEGRLNRMVAYRGNQLHCANLPAEFAPDADPLKGRLTLNLFLKPKSILCFSHMCIRMLASFPPPLRRKSDGRMA